MTRSIGDMLIPRHGAVAFAILVAPAEIRGELRGLKQVVGALMCRGIATPYNTKLLHLSAWKQLRAMAAIVLCCGKAEAQHCDGLGELHAYLEAMGATSKSKAGAADSSPGPKSPTTFRLSLPLALFGPRPPHKSNTTIFCLRCARRRKTPT